MKLVGGVLEGKSLPFTAPVMCCKLRGCEMSGSIILRGQDVVGASLEGHEEQGGRGTEGDAALLA